MTGDVPSPRLERPAGTPLAGVCAALARTTGTDAVLWRVGAVVLALFHGLGLVLYLLGYVLIPEEGAGQSLAQRLVHGPDRRLRGGQVLLLGLLLLGLVVLQDSDAVVVLLVLGGLFWLWWHSRGRTSPAAASTPAPHVEHVAGLEDAAVAAPGPVPAPVVPRSSPYGGLVASLALLTAGVLVLVGTVGDVSVPAEVVVAAALAVVGLGLVLTSFSGSSPGLVVLALLLAVALAATAGLQPFVDRGVGDRTWRPVGSGEYRLGVGNATLDLGALRTGDVVSVDAHVDVGRLTVLVPEDVHVRVDARSRLGQVDVFGRTDDGGDAHVVQESGPAGEPLVTVHAEVRLGQVEVRHG
jgi:phage shock protein PspC (stress-responsive transcriptional regulator)